MLFKGCAQLRAVVRSCALLCAVVRCCAQLCAVVRSCALLCAGFSVTPCSYCLHKIYDGTAIETRTCEFYSANFRLADLPTNSWQVACMSYGAGCALLCEGALLSMLTMCLAPRYTGRIVKVASFSQMLAGEWFWSGDRVVRNLAHKSQCCKYTLTEPHAPTMHVTHTPSTADAFSGRNH